MTDDELTADRLRLLILIARFSKPARTKDDHERWMKKMPLLSMVARGIHMGMFKDFDLHATLVDYLGDTRFATLSKEGEDDVADLRRLSLIERLKLATKHHFYVSAYRVTPKGLEAAGGAAKEHHDAIDRLTSCAKCGGRVEVVCREDSPYLVCGECDAEDRIPIFDIEEVPYTTSAVFSDVWLPD